MSLSGECTANLNTVLIEIVVTGGPQQPLVDNFNQIGTLTPGNNYSV